MFKVIQLIVISARIGIRVRLTPKPVLSSSLRQGGWAQTPEPDWGLILAPPPTSHGPLVPSSERVGLISAVSSGLGRAWHIVGAHENLLRPTLLDMAVAVIGPF